MDSRPLSLPPDEIRRLGYRVVDAIAEHWAAQGDAEAIRTGTPDELLARLGGPPPDGPGNADEALDKLIEDVLGNMQHGDHPRFFARVPSPSSPVGWLADALGAGFNAIAASWAGASGPTAVELTVLDWMRSWCGLPEDAEGILLSGGSLANLTAVAAAGRAPGVAYVSDQTHSSVLRALRLLGYDTRVTESDEQFRLRPEAIGDDAALVIANGGTTNTGAVDPIGELADLCAERGAWLHVDGAYGGPAVLTEAGAAALRGLERADSLVLDPHKWLFQPYEIGCVLVRRPGALASAFAMRPEYLRDVVGATTIDMRDRGPQLTRGARAMKLWLTLQVFGLDAVRDGIARGIELAEIAQRAIERDARLEIVTPAQLGVVTFRAPGVDAGQLIDRVTADGYAVPSSTVLRGETVLRLCTINPRTTDEEIETTVRRISELAT